MKKIISMILVCCISVSLLFVQGVAYAQDIYSDYYYDILKALEIDVKNSDDDYITKGEFCEIIADLMCVATDYDTSKLYFRDVSQSHKNYKAITALAEQGYIVGDDKGRFYPDEPLTLDVAKVMLVRCLGYELNSQVIGGWLIGYNKIANSLDLGEGVGKVSAEGLTANQVNRLIYNALLTPTCELDLTDKVTQKGITLGEKLYNAVEINGIVNQTVFTGIDVVEGSLEGTALIGEQSVYTGEIKAENYLGYTVRAMAVEEDDEYTLIAIVKDERNSELVLDYTEIEEEVTTDRIRFLRAEDSKVKTANLDRNVSVIYNYQKLSKFTAEDLKIDNGYMTLIDNDRDGEYDVIHVYEYKTYVVSGIDTSNGEIYDKYGYDALETEENTIIMNGYGYKVDVSTIGADSVLSVFSPKVENESSYTVIMVSGYEPVEGKVTSYQTDEDGIVTAKINGEEYIIDSRYLEVSSAQNLRFKKIQIGSSGIFLLNKDMLISGFASVSTDEMYGYLKRVYYDEEDEEKAYYEIFTQEGVFISGEINEKLKVNGTSVKNLSTLKSNIILFPNEKFKPQLVKFILNKDAKLSSLKIVDKAVVTDPIKAEDDVFCYSGQVKDGEMRPAAKRYAYKYLYDDATVIFNVPSEAETADKKKYSISSKTYVDGEDITLELYDVGFDLIIGAAVSVSGSNTVKFDNIQELTIVKSIREAYDEENDEVVMELTGYLKGAEVKYTSTLEDNWFDGFEEGDFVRILLDGTGEIIGTKLLFTFKEPGANADTDAITYYDKFSRKMPHQANPIPTGDHDYALLLVYGRCVAKGNNTIALTLDGGKSTYSSYIDKGAGYYMVEYDNGEVTVTPSSLSSILAASSLTSPNGHRVMISNRNAYSREVFIIKKD